MNAVFSPSLSSIGTYQYPLLRSMELNTVDFPREAKISSMCGNGHTDVFVILFSFLKIYTKSLPTVFLWH